MSFGFLYVYDPFEDIVFALPYVVIFLVTFYLIWASRILVTLGLSSLPEAVAVLRYLGTFESDPSESGLL
jgi:hypothetical protein